MPASCSLSLGLRFLLCWMGLIVPSGWLALLSREARESTLKPVMSLYHFGETHCVMFETRRCYLIWCWGLCVELEDTRRSKGAKAQGLTVLWLWRSSFWGREGRNRWPTFLSVLHGVTRNSAVSCAGWRQPAENHGCTASLLGNGAVRGRWNTFKDRNYGQVLFLQNLPSCTQVEHHLGNVT